MSTLQLVKLMAQINELYTQTQTPDVRRQLAELERKLDIMQEGQS